jgi:hypothetical protein
MHGADRAEFSRVGAALAWATARSPAIRVSIQGLGDWERAPSAADQAAIDAHIDRSRVRAVREAHEYAEPVEWFYAVDVSLQDPDGPDAEELAERASGEPGILSSRVERPGNGRPACWVVLRVAARSWRECSQLGGGALFRLVWPPERLQSQFGDGGWMVSVGGHEEFGLAEYESEVLGVA